MLPHLTLYDAGILIVLAAFAFLAAAAAIRPRSRRASFVTEGVPFSPWAVRTMAIPLAILCLLAFVAYLADHWS